MIKKIMLFLMFFISIFIPLKMIELEAREMNYYYIIDEYTEIEEKTNASEYVYIYFFKNSCTACNSFKEEINKVINDKDITVYAVNINSNNIDYLKLVKKYNLLKTPTFICYKNKKELSRIEGYVTYNELINFVKEYKNE